MKWSEIVNLPSLRGYERGTRPHTGLVDGPAIDREVAEDTACPECGGEMEYRPMVSGSSYRAFAVCKKCGETIEF